MEVLGYLLMFYLAFGLVLAINYIYHEAAYDPGLAGDYELWLVGLMITFGWPVAVWMATDYESEVIDEEPAYKTQKSK